MSCTDQQIKNLSVEKTRKKRKAANMEEMKDEKILFILWTWGFDVKQGYKLGMNNRVFEEFVKRSPHEEMIWCQDKCKNLHWNCQMSIVVVTSNSRILNYSIKILSRHIRASEVFCASSCSSLVMLHITLIWPDMPVIRSLTYNISWCSRIIWSGCRKFGLAISCDSFKKNLAKSRNWQSHCCTATIVCCLRTQGLSELCLLLQWTWNK